MSKSKATEAKLAGVDVDLPPGAIETLEFARSNPELFKRLSEVVLKEFLAESEARAGGDYNDLLLGLYECLIRRVNLSEGQLIRWKQGLKNKRRPAYGEPAVVVNLLAEPIESSVDNPGSTYFREPLDMIIGVLDDEKELAIYYVDRRRFEPYEDSHEPSRDSGDS
ncbi:hypothetical protein [Mycobacteroides abscessus]|uniref:hypothetical protein n=1 Tax=Mycobacteroides abscessus TaxID=36809 RepID=UPI001042222A|nr:hypothetical protein [Mycobacteroides abscessus]